jgi:hypothetical protein
MFNKIEKAKARLAKLKPNSGAAQKLARKLNLDLTPTAPAILSTVPIEPEPVKKTVKKKA